MGGSIPSPPKDRHFWSKNTIFSPFWSDLSLLWSLLTLFDVNITKVFREALQKTGVNINPILLRLKDRENAENDRNFDRRSINFPLFEMEFLTNWFGNPAQGR